MKRDTLFITGTLHIAKMSYAKFTAFGNSQLIVIELI